MVSVMLDGPKGVERRLRALVQPILAPSWLEYNRQPLTTEDHARAAEMLDLLIDILEDSGIGFGVCWFRTICGGMVTPRRLRAPCNTRC